MSTHYTPAKRRPNRSAEAAEPARRAPRFNERGIALQTVIIMVVLIAIAGAIAAVLFSAADEATTELENSSISVNVYAANNEGQCTRSDGQWTDDEDGPGAATAIAGQLAAAWGISAADANTRATANEGWCVPNG